MFQDSEQRINQIRAALDAQRLSATAAQSSLESGPNSQENMARSEWKQQTDKLLVIAREEKYTQLLRLVWKYLYKQPNEPSNRTSKDEKVLDPFKVDVYAKGYFPERRVSQDPYEGPEATLSCDLGDNRTFTIRFRFDQEVPGKILYVIPYNDAEGEGYIFRDHVFSSFEDLLHLIEESLARGHYINARGFVGKKSEE